MRQGAAFLILLLIAHAQTNPEALLDRARKDALRDRPKAEKLVRQVLSAWDASNEKGPQYADAEVLLSLLLLGNQAYSEVQPLAQSAVDIYDHGPFPVGGVRLALALDIQASILRLAHDEDLAKPISERAKEIRGELINAAPNQPAAPTARRIGGEVSAPSVLHKVEPEYCDEARLAKHQGTVVLSVVVEPNGTASQIRLMRSLGFGLDEKAVEAVRKWRFKPGMKDGEPVNVYATIEVNFRLL